MIVRQEKEQQKKRERVVCPCITFLHSVNHLFFLQQYDSNSWIYLQDQKKLQDQLKAEQEALYGSKPSPSKPQSSKKAPRTSMGGANRRLSLGGATLQPPKTDILHSKSVRAAKRTEEIATLSPGKPLLAIICCCPNFFAYTSDASDHFQAVEALTLPVFPSRSYLSMRVLYVRQRRPVNLLLISCQEAMSRRRQRGQSPMTPRTRIGPQRHLQH